MLGYDIDGPFVELRLDQTHPFTILRMIFEGMRDDPAVPEGALLVIDSRHRLTLPDEYEIRARLRLFCDLLLPRFAPVWAVILPPALMDAGKPLQQFARDAGLRIGLFPNLESARRWIGVYAPDSE